MKYLVKVYYCCSTDRFRRKSCLKIQFEYLDCPNFVKIQMSLVSILHEQGTRKNNLPWIFFSDICNKWKSSMTYGAANWILTVLSAPLLTAVASLGRCGMCGNSELWWLSAYMKNYFSEDKSTACRTKRKIAGRQWLSRWVFQRVLVIVCRCGSCVLVIWSSAANCNHIPISCSSGQRSGYTDVALRHGHYYIGMASLSPFLAPASTPDNMLVSL